MHELGLNSGVSPGVLPASMVLESTEACNDLGDLCIRYLVIRLLNRAVLGNLKVINLV